MRVFHFSINIENYFKKEFCLIKKKDYLLDENRSQTQYVLLEENCDKVSIKKFKKIIHVEMDTYMYIILESALKSNSCRSAFCDYMADMKIRNRLITIKVIMPKYHIIDKRGNKLFEISCLERRELDNAMAWFSTLGGAFSALGDQIEYCAIMAAKISQQQFFLALRLGDPNLVARCKLYMALSLIQQKKFSLAKKLIKSQYVLAKGEYERDKRLMTMCLGIWSKWKYERIQARLAKKPRKVEVSV